MAYIKNCKVYIAKFIHKSKFQIQILQMLEWEVPYMCLIFAWLYHLFKVFFKSLNTQVILKVIFGGFFVEINRWWYVCEIFIQS